MWFSAVGYIMTLTLSLLAVPLTSQAQRSPATSSMRSGRVCMTSVTLRARPSP
jgi:hypothetical protein